MRTFGDFIKEKRLAKKATLRQFCSDYGYDPGNISKLERNLMPPPQSEEKLDDFAKALSIKKGTDDYRELYDLAFQTNKTFQVKNISDENLLHKLPSFFRTLDNKNLTEEKLDRLIELIKNSNASSNS